MHNDAYIGGRSENNIKCIVHDDLGSVIFVNGNENENYQKRKYNDSVNEN